ncbi:hypothetical protein HanIR_Chr10g0492551 [Helianthus annuus]|nr:hypothetical protein HanIR_Chr10g0492551 [Helianthus annuus]
MGVQRVSGTLFKEPYTQGMGLYEASLFDFLHVQILKARRTWSMTSIGMKTRREGAQ